MDPLSHEDFLRCTQGGGNYKSPPGTFLKWDALPGEKIPTLFKGKKKGGKFNPKKVVPQQRGVFQKRGVLGEGFKFKVETDTPQVLKPHVTAMWEC